VTPTCPLLLLLRANRMAHFFSATARSIIVIIMSPLLACVVICFFCLCVVRVDAEVSSIRGSQGTAHGVNDVRIARRLNPGDVIPGSYIVQLKENDEQEVQALDFVLSLNTAPDRVFQRAMKGFSVKGMSESEAKKLAESPGVASVVPDIVVGLVTSHETVSMDDNVAVDHAKGQAMPWGVKRVKGGVTYTGDNVAWVLDTGIQLDHEDLNVDASRCHSIYGGSCADDHGHGTQYVLAWRARSWMSWLS
jgi:Peptidase inhibitor I9